MAIVSSSTVRVFGPVVVFFVVVVLYVAAAAVAAATFDNFIWKFTAHVQYVQQ